MTWRKSELASEGLVRTPGNKSKPTGTLSWCGTANVECLKQWCVWGRPVPLSWSCHTAVEVMREEQRLAGHESDALLPVSKAGWDMVQPVRLQAPHWTTLSYNFSLFLFVCLFFPPKSNCFQMLIICFSRNCKVAASSVKIFPLKYFSFYLFLNYFIKKICNFTTIIFYTRGLWLMSKSFISHLESVINNIQWINCSTVMLPKTSKH